MLFTERKTRDKLMNFRVTEQEHQALHDLSDARSEPITKIIRKALRRELDHSEEVNAGN